MEFSSELKKLNKQQRAAVEAIEGPVMVVAGPGTGKTQILTLRIANILQKTDTSPESILALTFTESAASAMRQRLLDIAGVVAHKVAIKTIHGFCNEIIQDHPQLFPMIAGEHNITEVEQIQIVRGLLESNRQRFARDIVSSMSELKREGLTPRDVEEHEELSQLYAAYQRELERRGRYDYDDMVLSVAAVLRKNKELRLTLRERYLYILVDEHQDTNQSQNDVIELLAGDDSPNLFVVGDAKQAIYRFQGARLENFAYFKKRFKKAQVIALTENYRSTQTVLDAALDVAVGEGALRANVKHPNKQISIAACATSASEAYVVARHIAERIRGGAKPEEIAVLYRTNKEGALVRRYLRKLGVPVAAADDSFADPDVRKLITLLEAVDGLGSDHALVPALYLDLHRVAPLDVAILLDTARQERRTVFSLVRDKKILERIVPESAGAAFALFQKLSLWRAKSKSFSLLPMFEEIVRETKLFAAGRALFAELQHVIARRRDTTLEDFLDHLAVMREHRVSLSLSAAGHELSAVQTMTAHKAKGLEFEYVYIVGAARNQWEDRRARNVFRFVKQDKDEATERNLFYVALTRAKKEVMISYAAASESGGEQLPSAFVASIRPELKKIFAVAEYEREYALHPEVEFREEARKTPQQEAVFLRKRFLEKGISASALNNYVECPNKFYFLNLIGLPEAPNPKAQAGNAAHAALKFAVEQKPGKQQILDRFERLLAKEPMREVDYREMLKKGRSVLGAYVDAHHKEWGTGMRCEYAVEASVGDIAIRGRIDRIDILTGMPWHTGDVRVVDYKFKKPMSRNEIIGATKNSEGNYYRQLTFYKLLIDEGTDWTMREGALDFLEPDAKGRLKQEVFAPSDKEVAGLKKEIQRVSKEILKMEFKGCGEKECKYCALVTNR